ncbi:MAG: DUF4268 domain-containing protein [bacterium]
MTNKELGLLTPVDVREYWVDEAQDFTPWLSEEKNLALLSETLGLDLELEDREVSVGSFKADIVARDATSDSKVIIENQLEKTDHDHLGKTITYASGLDAEIIIWIARQFTDEHRQAIDFLNAKASPDLQCFALEIQLWKIGQSMPAPMFKIVASPNEYRVRVDAGPKKMTEAKTLYLEFWTAFRDYCGNTGTFLSIRKPCPQMWFSIAVGRSKFSIYLTASIQKSRIACEIYMRGANATNAFRLLHKEKDVIEKETGPLDWRELPEGKDCRIMRFKNNVDISKREIWSEAHAWMKDEAERFHNAFSRRIKALPNLDEFDEEERVEE